MKNFLKNIALFIVLAFAVSALVSCSGSQTASVNESNSPANADNSAPAKSKVNYPPAPSAIMQADVKNLDGTTFKFQDKKGKVVLINLWATWCRPCIQEMPHLVEMQEKYRDKGFEIIGLDVDESETKEQIDNFAAKQKLNYQLGWADRAMFNEFIKVNRVDAIPQSLLINREGQLTGRFIGGGPSVIKELKETVEKIVNE
jgi:thiol-disulfide isomerase/thioredoxin